MTTKAKVGTGGVGLRRKIRIYEKVLGDIACWHDAGSAMRTKDIGGLDEPGSAAMAREALIKTKAVKRIMRLEVNLDSAVFRCPCGSSAIGHDLGFDAWAAKHVLHTSDRGKQIEETLTADGARAGGKPGTKVRPWQQKKRQGKP
jgi:hypothetical protein